MGARRACKWEGRVSGEGGGREGLMGREGKWGGRREGKWGGREGKWGGRVSGVGGRVSGEGGR